MKRFFLLFTFFVLLSGTSHAVDDPLKGGMQLYKKHRFEEAFNRIYDHLAEAESNRRDRTYLSLGMICLENAKLYRELYRVSIMANLDYLTRLISDESQSNSCLAKLYLGKTLLQTGELMESAGFFDKFIAEKKTGDRDRQIAKIGLGTAYYLQGKHKRAERYWAKLNTTDPQVMAALASAYSSVGLSEKEPVSIFIRAIAAQPESGNKPMIQAVSDSIGVYAEAGLIDESFKLLKRVDLKAFFHEETLAKNKTIRFYDPALLQNLSLLYSKAGLKFLNEAGTSTDKKIKVPAKYYLSEGYELFGKPEQAKQAVEEVVSSGGMPARIANRSKVRLALVDYILGNKQEAEDQLNALLKIKSDPDLAAEMLLSCSNHQIDFPQAVISASAIAQASEGKPFANINFALGKYYLWKKDYVKAVSYMEAGRDKSNKNRVENNNLLMLVNLAEAYYRSKKFSEALEIFFEMSKHYPAVRQIQVTMQGVYSMEQQSAGDAKIF